MTVISWTVWCGGCLLLKRMGKYASMRAVSLIIRWLRRPGRRKNGTPVKAEGSGGSEGKDGKTENQKAEIYL